MHLNKTHSVWYKAAFIVPDLSNFDKLEPQATCLEYSNTNPL